MLGYYCLYSQVASLAAVCSWLTAASHTDTLAIVNTCRDRNFKFLANSLVSGTIAVRAFLLNDFTCTVTLRTGLYILNLTKVCLLCIHDLTFPFSLGPGLWGSTWLCASSVTA